LVSVYL